MGPHPRSTLNPFLMSTLAPVASESLAANRLDEISFGKIVQIREVLLARRRKAHASFGSNRAIRAFRSRRTCSRRSPRRARRGRRTTSRTTAFPSFAPHSPRSCARRTSSPTSCRDDVFLTNGAMHALYVAFGALLDAGDEVIIPDPMWTEVAENIKLAGGIPVRVAVTAASDYAYDPARSREAITPATRAIFVNSPHNPTGAMASRETLEAIVELAREHDLWIVSDEAYEDVVYEPNVAHVARRRIAGDWADRVISVFSFSKSHAMSGLRTGYSSRGRRCSRSASRSCCAARSTA